MYVIMSTCKEVTNDDDDVSSSDVGGSPGGARLGVRPTTASYRRLRTTPQHDVTTAAWSAVGKTIRQVMSQRQRPRRSGTL